MTWATLVAIICGSIEFGLPLEDVYRGVRAELRKQPADGSIVIVEIDDRTIERVSDLQPPRDMDALVVRRLFDLGARRVFFDRALADASAPAKDQALANELVRHRGKVFLGGIFSEKNRNTGVIDIGPTKVIRDAAEVRSLSARKHPFSLSLSFPLSSEFEGKRIPSLTAELAGVRDDSGITYRPDFAIRTDTVPRISYLDIVDGKVSASAVSGRDMIIAPTATVFRDYHTFLWFPETSGAFFHAIGAQTLKRGMPLDIGWIPAVVVAFGFAAFRFTRAKPLTRRTILYSIGLLFFGPLACDFFNIGVDVVPAGLLLTVAFFGGRNLEMVQFATRINEGSGLPRVHSLREEVTFRADPLVALKITNFAAITASFDQDVEGAVVRQILRRIRLLDAVAEIFHNEAYLLWFAAEPDVNELRSHLQGLSKLMIAGIELEGRQIDVAISFGIDNSPDRRVSSRVGSAIQSADEAESAGQSIRIYDENRQGDAAWHLSLLSELDQAIDSGDVRVAYQPKLDLRNNRIHGAEALVRWDHPRRGPIAPDMFIQILEKHNRIERLTRYVLKEACRTTSEFVMRGCDVSISVNISAQMFEIDSFPEMVALVLDETGLAASRLTLEVTETGQMVRNSRTLAMLHRLTEMDVRISIDDFGVGNATLDYLRLLPATEVKLDKGFVTNMMADRQDRLIVKSMIEMAHSLGRTVVAEGVETELVLAELRALDCDVAQGYRIGQALTLRQWSKVLDDQQARYAA